MAIEYAVYVYKMLPNIKTNTAPLELITESRLQPGEVKNCRVWGCPAYALDPKVQDGNKLPRWVPKARRGQFVGRSNSHASNIGLIRNLKSGSISSQFHVTYDDFFSTIPFTNENVHMERIIEILKKPKQLLSLMKNG